MRRRTVPRTLTAALLSVASLALAACTGNGPANPTTPPPSTPSASPTLSAAGERCLAEATFLEGVATASQSVLATLNLTSRTFADLQTAVAGQQAQVTRLDARLVHVPFVDDKATLRTGLQDVIAGLQAEEAANKRTQVRAAQHTISLGAGEVATAAANAQVERETCGQPRTG